MCFERFLCGDVYLGCQELLQMGSFHLLHLKKFYPRFKRGLCDEASMTVPSPQERLVGERVVVKEIEIFGNFWYSKVGEDNRWGQTDSAL